MGHRANYLIIEGGQVTHLRYSQFGATSIPWDVLVGPASFSAYVARLEPRDRLLNTTYCEGVALMDRDRQVLLFFEHTGNPGFNSDLVLRRHLMQAIREAWPGWTVRYAYQQLDEICDYLGWPLPDDTHGPAPWRSSTPISQERAVDMLMDEVCSLCGDCTEEENVRYPGPKYGYVNPPSTLVTVADENGVLDFLTYWSPKAFALVGLPFLGLRPIWQRLATSSLYPDEQEAWQVMLGLGGGLIVDGAARRVALWDLRREWPLPVYEQLRQLWPGWAITRVPTDLVGHFALSRRPALAQRVLAEPIEARLQAMRADIGMYDPTRGMRRYLAGLEAQGATLLHVNPTAIDGQRDALIAPEEEE